MTKDEALTMCLEYIETDKHERKYVRHAIKAALEQQAKQIGWAVQGCSKMWRGEFAEIDAKAEAKRIGGTCVAFALYTEPPQREWQGLTVEEIDHQAKKDDHGAYFALGALWAEAKLKELNK